MLNLGKKLVLAKKKNIYSLYIILLFGNFEVATVAVTATRGIPKQDAQEVMVLEIIERKHH